MDGAEAEVALKIKKQLRGPKRSSTMGGCVGWPFT